MKLDHDEPTTGIDPLRELGKQLPWDRPDATRREGVRSSLLVAAADTPPRRSNRAHLVGAGFVAGALVAAAVALVLVRASSSPSPSSAPVASTPAREIYAQVESSSVAELEHTTTPTPSGTDEVVRVRGGTVRLAVPAVRAGDRVRTKTGDAEVEGTGAYEVIVANDKLTSVRVSAGTAKVIVDGQTIVLASGETWTAPIITADLTPTPTDIASDLGLASTPPAPRDIGEISPSSAAPGTIAASTASGSTAASTASGSTAGSLASGSTAGSSASGSTAGSTAIVSRTTTASGRSTTSSSAVAPASGATSTTSGAAASRTASTSSGAATSGTASGTNAVRATPPSSATSAKASTASSATSSSAATPSSATPSNATSANASAPSSAPSRASTSATPVPSEATARPSITTSVPAPSIPPVPSSTEQHFQTGWALLRDGKYSAAAAELALAASGTEPLASDARYFQAIALTKAGRAKEAETAIVAFLNKAPTSTRRGRAAVMLGRLIAARGDTTSARAWFTSALGDPDASVAGAAKAELAKLP